MYIYFGIVTFAIALYFLLESRFGETSEKGKKLFAIVMAVVFILQSGLRHECIGIDTENYKNIFEIASSTSWGDAWGALWARQAGTDPGYAIFQKIFQLIIPSFRGYLIFVAICFFGAFWRWAYLYSTSMLGMLFSVVFYQLVLVSFFSFTGIRQTLAVALCLFSFDFLIKRKPLAFLTFVLVASTIHFSAIVFVPAYLFCRIQRIRLFLLGIFAVFIAVFPLRYYVAELISSVVGVERYAGYAQNTDYSRPESLTVFWILVVVGALVRVNQTVRAFPISRFYFCFVGVALAIMPLAWVNPTFLRLTFYFSPYFLLLFPASLDSFKASNRAVSKIVYFLAISGIYTLLFFNRRSYYFFWDTPLGEVITY